MTRMVPTIAAIVPNFNYAKFLPRTIESLLSQTVPFDEVIVVDDGSTDNSLDVMATYGNSIRTISKANGGQISCCLAGLQASRSDYIYVLDADDWVSADMCAEIRPFLVRRPGKIQFLLQTTDVDGAPKGHPFPQYPAGYDAEMMQQDNKVRGFYLGPPTSGNVFSREMLEKVDLARLDQRDFADGVPTLAAPYLGEVITIPKVLAYYRIHDSSDSQASNISEHVLQREVSLLNSRWDQMERLVGIPRPFGDMMPLLLAERYLMIAAIKKRGLPLKTVWDFLLSLNRTNSSRQRKLAWGVWALLLIVPVAGLRRSLITYRRVGTSRPRVLEFILKAVNRS